MKPSLYPLNGREIRNAVKSVILLATAQSDPWIMDILKKVIVTSNIYDSD